MPTPPQPPEREPHPDEPPMPRAREDRLSVIHVVRIRDDEESFATERRLRFGSQEDAHAAVIGALTAGLWADVQVVYGKRRHLNSMDRAPAVA